MIFTQFFDLVDLGRDKTTDVYDDEYTRLGRYTVREVSGSAHRVLASMSQNTGLAPAESTARAVAIKVFVGTMTSSSCPRSRERSTASRAAVPELTAMLYLVFDSLANSSSNLRTNSCEVSMRERTISSVNEVICRISSSQK